MGQVIYLTGSPATGKSTLCQHLENVVPDMGVYAYSKLLRDYVNQRSNTELDETGIRQHSANVITREDVNAVDKWLIDEVGAKRQRQHMIIDSHAVTKEDYGFRVTAFSLEQLKQLNPDVIVCLYATTDEIKMRISNDSAGRPMPNDFELGLHTDLQTSLAVQYAFMLGRPCYLLNSAIGLEELAENILRVSNIT